MSSEDKAGLVVLFRGLAVGLGFVWLFGFAVGYQGAGWVACYVLAGLAVGSLVVASRLNR
jgi:SNF family Na+-dependent transporter